MNKNEKNNDNRLQAGISRCDRGLASTASARAEDKRPCKRATDAGGSGLGVTRPAPSCKAADPLAALSRLALRPREAARLLGVSERKLRDLPIPRVRVDRTVLFPVDSVRDWLRATATVREAPADRRVKVILAQLKKQ